MNYFIVDFGIYFDVDLDDEYFEYNDDLQSYIGDTAKDMIKDQLSEYSNTITEYNISDYELSNDNEFDYYVYMWLATNDTIKSKEELKSYLTNTVFKNPISWKDSADLFDGSYSIERHGFDYGPGEEISNSSYVRFNVSITPTITNIELSNEEGDLINEEVTFFEELDKQTQNKLKNQLKDRAAHHKKRLRGLPRGGLCPNPEASRQFFNMMNTPNGGPTNNPISGPFGGDVESGDGGAEGGMAMGEELTLVSPNHHITIGNLVRTNHTTKHPKTNMTGKVVDKLNGRICVVEWEDNTTTKEFQGSLSYCEVIPD